MVALQQDSEQTPDDGFRIMRRKLLLVEGEDERRVFGVLVRQMWIDDVQIHPYGGKNQLRPFLKNLVVDTNFPNLSSIAVVMDADTNSDAAKDRIRGALETSGLPAPRSALSPMSDGGLTVSFLVVPHESGSGALEDVVLASVADDPAIECTDSFLECIRATDLPGPNPTHLSKAKVHVFLASRERPDLRLGEAAERGGIWRFEAESFDSLKQLLTAM